MDKPLVETLKGLQNALGDWHDRSVLHRLCCGIHITAERVKAESSPTWGGRSSPKWKKKNSASIRAINQLFADAAG